jgi:hypothetical protein
MKRTVISWLAILAMYGSIASCTRTATPSVNDKESDGAVQCTTDKEDIPTCTKKMNISSYDKLAGPACRWNCVFECNLGTGRCVWICRGNGSQCNGKSPLH